MSRIGKKAITLPSGVEVTVQANVVIVKGSKGELTVNYEPEHVSITVDGNTVTVERNNDSKEARSRHGLYRSLLANAAQGVTEGFEKKLEIRGVGYRAAVKGTSLELQLGYSHPINFVIPQDVKVEMDKENQAIIVVNGIDKQRVGQIAAEIRSFRKPEPYKGKGIKFVGEQIRRKAGKSA